MKTMKTIMNKTPNPHAVAMGRMARGYKKTMSPAALAQRKAASAAATKARKLAAKARKELAYTTG